MDLDESKIIEVSLTDLELEQVNGKLKENYDFDILYNIELTGDFFITHFNIDEISLENYGKVTLDNEYEIYKIVFKEK